MHSSENSTKDDTGKQETNEAVAPPATEEQLIYADLLNVGMKIGLVFLIVTFVIYAGGIFQPEIPIADVSKYWELKSHEYLQATNIEPGWSWLGKYSKGDFINFFPIAFLAGISIACYIAIIPTLIRKKDTIYVILALIEVVVLAGAASGLIAGGH